VRLLVRRPPALDPKPPGCELAVGDVLDETSVARSLSGCDAVVHLAAVVKRWARDRRLFDRVNVEATARLFDLAERARVGRVIYCSSFLALGPTDGSVGDEDTAHDGRPRNDYERTKWRADQQARRRQEEGAPLVILYPGVVYGPGRMTAGNILGDAAQRLIEGRFPGIVGPGDRRWCLAFVEDVALGFRLALERAAPGARYVLGGENLTLTRILDLIAGAAGAHLPGRHIPYSVAAAIGRVLRWGAFVTGGDPQLTDEEVEIYRREWAYSSARAERELGYRITPAAEGLTRMVRWLQARKTDRGAAIGAE
jgi:farnesol dehydrogenase